MHIIIYAVQKLADFHRKLQTGGKHKFKVYASLIRIFLLEVFLGSKRVDAEIMICADYIILFFGQNLVDCRLFRQ